jgi:hypothetical protein
MNCLNCGFTRTPWDETFALQDAPLIFFGTKCGNRRRTATPRCGCSEGACHRHAQRRHRQEQLPSRARHAWCLRAARATVAHQYEIRLANMATCLIGIGACFGVHHLARPAMTMAANTCARSTENRSSTMRTCSRKPWCGPPTSSRPSTSSFMPQRPRRVAIAHCAILSRHWLSRTAPGHGLDNAQPCGVVVRPG